MVADKRAIGRMVEDAYKFAQSRNAVVYGEARMPKEVDVFLGSMAELKSISAATKSEIVIANRDHRGDPTSYECVWQGCHFRAQRPYRMQ